MPPCTAAHLVGYLFEMGPTVSTGMGESPLPHTEIAAWMANTGIRLTCWETRTLRRLSCEYAQSSYLSQKPDCPAPWADAPYCKPAPNLVAQRMRAEMRRQAAL